MNRDIHIRAHLKLHSRYQHARPGGISGPLSFHAAPIYRSFILAAGLALAVGGTALAAEDREPVEEICLAFESEIETGGSSSEVEVTTEDGGYTVGGVEVVNATGDWAGGVRPRVEVYLYADDGYYFPRVREDMFELSGEGAEYVSARRQEDNTELVLTVRLEALDEEDLTVDGVGWDREEGLAIWEENSWARGYEVRLYRGETLVDSVTLRSSSETSWSFSGRMKESGSYYFQVRAVGSGSARGPWESSGKWRRSGSGTTDWETDTTSDSDKEMVSPSGSSKPQEGYYSDEEFDPDKDYDEDYDRDSWKDQDEDGGPGSSQQTVSTPGGSGGSGSVTAGSSGSSSGSSATSSGSSATSSRSVTAGNGNSQTSATPGTTAITTIQTPIRTGAGNRWNQDQQGWWLELKDGTWPVNAWAMVDGTWYCFDSGGYLRHGWILSGDKWYYCEESGAMLVNARTPDGHFVGGDGVWIQ